MPFSSVLIVEAIDEKIKVYPLIEVKTLPLTSTFTLTYISLFVGVEGSVSFSGSTGVSGSTTGGITGSSGSTGISGVIGLLGSVFPSLLGLGNLPVLSGCPITSLFEAFRQLHLSIHLFRLACLLQFCCYR